MIAMPVELTGRHLDLGQPSEPWHCPACGEINAGEIAAGCASCGSGSAQARKAPVPPAVPVTPPIARRTDPRDPIVLPPAVDDAQAVGDQCDRWLAHFRDADRLPASVRAWIVDAFHAGWHAARRQADPTRRADTASVPAPDLPFPMEGKVARTLAVALRLFRDNTLIAADEEIAAGEWCSLDEAEALIARLEAEGANPYHG